MEFINQLILHYGYYGIFFLLVGGIIGLPIPDEVLLTFVGYNIFLGKMSYSLALLSAFSGAIIGISLSYFLGFKLGLPFLRRYGPKLFITKEKIERTQVLFKKWGPLLLFMGYFLPGFRHITAYLAGISSLRFRTFTLYAYSGALIWVFLFIFLGEQLGKRWIIVAGFFLHYHNHIFLFGICLFLILFGILLYSRKK